MDHPDLGSVSADGNFYWDGVRWMTSLSPDGYWRWAGAAWVPAQPHTGEPAEPYASTRSLAVGVSILLGLSAAASVVEALFVNDFMVFTGQVGGSRFEYSVGFIGFVIFAVAAVLFLVWFHRSYRNLTAFGMRDLQSSAAWAVGWWFVPIGGLWRPYQASVEIWKASDAGAPLLIRFWWAAWLISLFLFNVAAFSVPDNSLLYWQSSLSALATVVAALLAILFVTSVSASQDNRWRHGKPGGTASF